VNKSFWIERWSKNEIGFHQSAVNQYLQSHWPRLGVAKGATVFVPLCGKSLDMIWLREQGYLVVGVEVARVAVREFFSEHKLKSQISVEPFFERWEAEGFTVLAGDLLEFSREDLPRIDAVFDRASLIAFPPDMRPRYVEKMRALVPRTATTLLVSLTYPQAEMKGPPFSVDEAEVRRLYSNQKIEKLFDEDVLSRPENARFQERGITQMSEQVYRISHA
jgi:thiopurine S-methyltransferase